MTEIDSEAADVIEAYRKRKNRLGPLILGGVAIVLLVVGIFFIVLWFTGDSPPAIAGIFASQTPTATETQTPSPPTMTATVTPTLPPSSTPTPSGPITYIVEPGDTLSSIAEEFGVEIVLLMALNNITDPNQLFVNTEIIIPASETVLPTKTPLPENLFTGQQIEYQIQPGDTLETIAAEFNSTAEAIAELNEIEDPNTIGVGQIILVPVNIATPTPTFTPVIELPTATPGS
jgi:LysM repeat protein